MPARCWPRQINKKFFLQKEFMNKIAFTLALDVVMTHSFDMWYWSEKRFYEKLTTHFGRVEMYPITDWLPYPHVIYLCENVSLETKGSGVST